MRVAGLIFLVLWFAACGDAETKKETPADKPPASEPEKKSEPPKILKPGEAPKSE